MYRELGLFWSNSVLFVLVLLFQTFVVLTSPLQFLLILPVLIVVSQLSLKLFCCFPNRIFICSHRYITLFSFSFFFFKADRPNVGFALVRAIPSESAES